MEVIKIIFYGLIIIEIIFMLIGFNIISSIIQDLYDLFNNFMKNFIIIQDKIDNLYFTLNIFKTFLLIIYILIWILLLVLVYKKYFKLYSLILIIFILIALEITIIYLLNNFDEEFNIIKDKLSLENLKLNYEQKRQRQEQEKRENEKQEQERQRQERQRQERQRQERQDQERQRQERQRQERQEKEKRKNKGQKYQNVLVSSIISFMPSLKKHFDILGFSDDEIFNKSTLNKHYRDKARKFHPDTAKKNYDNDIFLRITEANDVLQKYL